MSGRDARRAAITGVGLVTVFGRASDTWSAVREGRSGIRAIDINRERVLGAPAVAFSGADSPEPNVAMALAAARDAVADAGLDVCSLSGPRAASTVSSSKGGMKSLFQCHRAFCEGAPVPPEFWELISPSTPGLAVAREFGITGPVVNYAAACATGIHAVIAGSKLIASGDADVVLAGATDASLVQPLVAAFDRMGVLSRRMDDPSGACRPFDRARDGFAIGEGAAVMVLEAEDRVATNPERAYAWVAGSSWGADAFDLARVDASHGALARLLGGALRDAGLSPDRVDYVNAHGTGTHDNDPAESAAIREALGESWKRAAVSSLKPAIGHCLGAAGGAELALTVLAMRDGFLPPTLNLTDPDPACELNHVAKVGRSHDIRSAIKIAVGFGGHIGIVVLERGRRSR